MSSPRPGIVERAFQLARSGTCLTVSEIQEQLAREDYLHIRDQFSSGYLRTQLREAIKQARQASDSA